jgi:endogenous inhibitor of DNA gyrase (YacG/DUF329 family)
MSMCPHCKKPIGRLTISPHDGGVPFGGVTWKCISFDCPLCQASLSVQIDPIAIKNDIVNELLRKLGRVQ